ncbi:aminotransferase class V-fold PLP-dependent enzyme, partial [Janthinobacterium sp. BJB401]|uniref:aminotransferase class V-fold PLP-dependent enzyme n=1 Tax=Janthinobacterium sp. BJB401 TaxID=2745934 RepID=UPI001595D35B
MNARELLAFFRRSSVELQVVDRKIKFKAPGDIVTPDILAALKAHKNEILALLSPAPAMLRRAANRCQTSFAQQRLWFIDRIVQGSAIYHIPVCLRLLGRLDRAALERTLNEVVRRHEALRTTFDTADGMPVQVIASELRLAMPVTDLSALSSGERRAKAEWLAQDEAQAPFDLHTGPLLRTRLIALGESEHMFLLTVHHIVADGWSMGVLVREVAALYSTFVGAAAPLLPELAVQYADYAHWQRQWLEGEVLQHQLAYWKVQLRGAPTLLSLPTDRPRPPMQTYQGASVRVAIGAQTGAALHRLGQQTQGTLFMTLTAAFNILLSRYAGQDDICIGTPIANRQRAEVEPLIGFFANTLVLRTQVDAANSFNALLEQVRASTLDAYAHQDVPFEQLVEALKPERHVSHSPLFQVMFVLQNAPMDKLELPGLELQLVERVQNGAKFDLTLTLAESPDGLRGDIEYNTDLFERTTIERMAGHFVLLLEAIIANPHAPVHELDMLAESERRQLLVEWNQTAQDYEHDHTLHALFEAQVARTPGNPAVQFEDQVLSYRELNERANRLAHYLRRRGVVQDTVVGLCVERCADMVVGMLGVLKAGGAYVPLDPAYPQERLAYMVSNAKPAVILTQQHLRAHLPQVAGGVFCLDSQWQELAGESPDNPVQQGDAGSTAYVIYTSGSTGRPKGVRGGHRAMVNRLRWMERHARPAADEVFCQKTTIAFVDHVAEVFQPLLCGLPLLVIPAEQARDPARLSEAICAGRVTRLTVVPSLLRVLLDDAIAPQLQGLRYVVSSGEALTLRTARAFRRCLPGTRLLNLYGSTEVGADATCFEFAPLSDQPEIMEYFAEQEQPPCSLTPAWGMGQSGAAVRPALNIGELAASFGHAAIPDRPMPLDEYARSVNEQVIPNLIDVSSDRFIGHMTSKLPSFVTEIGRLITQLNQNMVKIETSKGMTFLERQVLASMHQLFFGLEDNYYAGYCQDPAHVFGVVVGGGSVANITALWYARNRALLGLGIQKSDLVREGYQKSLAALGFERGVILGTRLLHYSIKKAIGVFGIGQESFIEVAQDDRQRMSMTDLERCIEVCRQKNYLILAIVGVAGATETGTIDPLEQIAAMAQRHGIHFHVDAAWGGAFQFSAKHRYKLAGIEHADSLTLCPHKQLFLPQGISLCLFRETSSVAAIATHAEYQAQQGSYDLGQYSLEGSRPANALFLHASLRLISKQGYAWLIDQSMEKTLRLVRAIEQSPCFELAGGQPELNIVNYRYLPSHLRGKKGQGYTADEHEAISDAVERIQKLQFDQGKTFVSRTRILLPAVADTPLSVFRVVLSNPLTTLASIKEVLDDQLRIAQELIEPKGVQQPAPETDIEAAQSDTDSWLVPIGSPIANCKVYLLDAWRKLVPQGVIGEMYIGGDCLARDYLGDTALTGARFIGNPFSDDPADRLFKTGDLARWSADGRIEYKGRRDFQVKLRGFRIELGEIESQLLVCADVREAAVAMREDVPGDKRLVAYVVAGPDAQLSVAQLQAQLQAQLPDYMVPTAWMVLDALPLTPNGKVDWKALPAPDAGASQQEYVAPQTATEIAIA